MARRQNQIRLLPENPFAVISALIGVIEIAFSYPVTRLSGSNQTIVVMFMVTFPILLLLCFFGILWFKPTHLYGPDRFRSDKAFLSSLSRFSAIKDAKDIYSLETELEYIEGDEDAGLRQRSMRAELRVAPEDEDNRDDQ